MSDREKKLVLFFGLGAFVLLNLFGFSKFRVFRTKVANQVVAAKAAVATAEENREEADSRSEEMEWLTNHYPEAKAGQTVQTELQLFGENQATANQLTVGNRRFLPIEEGSYFQRAKVEFKVTGTEAALYRWLDRLQMPDQFRTVTFLRLSPDAKDDTLIDCTAIAEQWFVPPAADADAEGEAVEPGAEAPATSENTPPTPQK
ncbi:hypothetical protein [Luteolibacter sp. Populi]|uniref:hypothetical protein n=1 Tax=Luteolibacter sp. Populi TaxID=3230487 RepID=UPI0034663774